MSREKVKLDKVLELNTALVGIKAKLADKSNLDFELLTLKFKQLDGLVREFSDEELIEDKNCIGNMKQASNYPDKKSIVYTYKFSDQEYKFKKNDRVVIANNINSDKINDRAGVIVSLDQINKRIKLKKQTKNLIL